MSMGVAVGMAAAAYFLPRYCVLVCDYFDNYPIPRQENNFLPLTSCVATAFTAMRTVVEACFFYVPGADHMLVSIYDSAWIAIFLFFLFSCNPVLLFGYHCEIVLILYLSMIIEIARKCLERLPNFPERWLSRTSPLADEVMRVRREAEAAREGLVAQEPVPQESAEAARRARGQEAARAAEAARAQEAAEAAARRARDREAAEAAAGRIRMQDDLGNLDNFFVIIDPNTVPPEERVCPISFEVTANPVRLHCNCRLIYDRPALTRWIREHGTCPTCRAIVRAR